MKAVVIRRYGAPEVFTYENYPDPRTGPSEALVRATAVGGSPLDLSERKGLTEHWQKVGLMPAMPTVIATRTSSAMCVSENDAEFEAALGPGAARWRQALPTKRTYDLT